MKRPDPLQAGNRRVREFAERHRLRTAVRDDGEVVLCLGPRRLPGAGEMVVSDSHASFGLRPGVWTVFVGPTSSRRVAAVAARWRRLGLAPHVLDFEIWTDVPEERLLEVLNACSATRPRRRRSLSPVQRAVATSRLAKHRRSARAPRPPKNGGFAPADRADAAGAMSEPSATSGAESPVVPPVFHVEPAQRVPSRGAAAVTDAALPSVRTRLGEGLVTADEVALFLGVHRSTVFRLAGKELPVVAIGRAKRFRPSDVAALVDAMTRQDQGRSGRARRLLSAARNPRRNELASPRRQSVHPKQERPPRNAGAREAAP